MVRVVMVMMGVKAVTVLLSLVVLIFSTLFPLLSDARSVIGNIITNLHRNTQPYIEELKAEQAFYFGRTFASVALGTDGNLAYCRLEKDDTLEIKEMNNIVKKSPVPVKKAGLDDMLSIISTCSSLPTPPSRLEPLRALGTQLSRLNVLTLAHGIAPGTKWCGVQNVAHDSYFELGYHEDVDRCCRAHDHCPINRPSSSPNNTTPFTLSHCKCDILLYNCLRSISTPTSTLVGMIYFNIGRQSCIEEKEGSAEFVVKRMDNLKF